MKVVYYEKNNRSTFDSFDCLIKKNCSLNFCLTSQGLEIVGTKLSDRFFFSMYNGTLYLSKTLSDLVSEIPKLRYSSENVNFYKKFGFLLPPYTQYEDIFIITPHRRFTINCDLVRFKHEPLKVTNIDVDFEKIILNYFDNIDTKELSVLVSGGIDSSALLGIANDQSFKITTYMCKMSSLMKESDRAKSICNTIGVDFTLIDLDKDLSSTAKEFLAETGELISDSIAVVMSELFKNISTDNNGRKLNLVDGQGADSLLNGLPLNKIYEFKRKLGWLSLLFRPFGFMPIYNNKSSNLKRKLYRITKSLKCLGKKNFSESIVVAITENEMVNKKLEPELILRLNELFNVYKDWHLVLRIFYMFDVLPAREMQKYLLAEMHNIKIVAPFLDASIIDSLIFLDNKSTIQDGVFKLPITEMARKYWPGYFYNTNTSPFQVNYSIDNGNIKDYSMNNSYAKKDEF